jgi:hypothetical protein
LKSGLVEILSESINNVLKVKKTVIKTLGKLKLYNALLKIVVGLYPSNRKKIDALFEKLVVALDGFFLFFYAFIIII